MNVGKIAKTKSYSAPFIISNLQSKKCQSFFVKIIVESEFTKVNNVHCLKFPDIQYSSIPAF